MIVPETLLAEAEKELEVAEALVPEEDRNEEERLWCGYLRTMIAFNQMYLDAIKAVGTPFDS